MFLALLLLIGGLTISGVAVYYSVLGLAAIFAAATIPIYIMGGALEISKLIAASWLKANWNRASGFIKYYLVIAVVILMVITSMGIFGFLSKAHIDQTANATEGIAQIERYENDITRNEEIILRAQQRISELETGGSGATTQIQQQIDLEQERIESAYARVEPAIKEQQGIIEGQTALFRSELAKIDEQITTLKNLIKEGEIATAQGIVGTKADGSYGPATAQAFRDYEDRKIQERNEWLDKIENASGSNVVIDAREEISRLRGLAETQIEQSNNLINNLRNQLSADNGNDIQTLISEQNNRIRTATTDIDTILDEKFKLESEYRKLEAEVGPVKYIAEFIYGTEADTNLLEKAVTWVIILIVIVFDPLAIAMLLAAQITFGWLREDKKKQELEKPLIIEPESNTPKESEVSSYEDAVIEEIVKEEVTTDVVEDIEIDAYVPEYNTENYNEIYNEYENLDNEQPESTDSEKEVIETIVNSYNDILDNSNNVNGVDNIDVEPLQVEEIELVDEIIDEVNALIEEQNVVAKELFNNTADSDKTLASESIIVEDNENIEMPVIEEEEPPKKKIHDQELRDADSTNKEVTKITNSFKPKDYLMFAYNKTNFDDFQYDPEVDAELDKFIKAIKNGNKRFGDYSLEQLKTFASRIYELRKN